MVHGVGQVVRRSQQLPSFFPFLVLQSNPFHSIDRLVRPFVRSFLVRQTICSVLNACFVSLLHLICCGFCWQELFGVRSTVWWYAVLVGWGVWLLFSYNMESERKREKKNTVTVSIFSSELILLSCSCCCPALIRCV